MVRSCTLSGNSAYFGGGINSGGTLTVDHSTISGNAASGHGGGIIAFGTLTVNHSTISDNTAVQGGGLYVSGGSQAEIDHSTVNDPNGGGIHNDGSTVHLKKTVVDGVLYKDQYYS